MVVTSPKLMLMVTLICEVHSRMPASAHFIAQKISIAGGFINNGPWVRNEKHQISSGCNL